MGAGGVLYYTLLYTRARYSHTVARFLSYLLWGGAWGGAEPPPTLAASTDSRSCRDCMHASSSREATHTLPYTRHVCARTAAAVQQHTAAPGHGQEAALVQFGAHTHIDVGGREQFGREQFAVKDDQNVGMIRMWACGRPVSEIEATEATIAGVVSARAASLVPSARSALHLVSTRQLRSASSHRWGSR